MPERGQTDPAWVTVSSKFPSTLAKDAPPETLEDGQTPEAYGLGLDKPGWLYYDSSPAAGSQATQLTDNSAPGSNNPIDAGINHWHYWFNRLWGYGDNYNVLWYGALGYTANFVYDGLSKVEFAEESANITGIGVLPLSKDILVAKGEYLYIIPNADSTSGNFQARFVRRDFTCTGINATATTLLNNILDNTFYATNTKGIFGFDGQNVTELTYPIRNNLGAFSSDTIINLNADYSKNRLIGRDSTPTTKFIIEVTGDSAKLFDYNTSGFRFTTPTVQGKDGEPLTVDKVALLYTYTAGARATVDVDVKINDTWKAEKQFTIVPATSNGRAELFLSNNLVCRRWAVRLNSISPNLYISAIQAHVKQGGIQGYSNK